MSGTESTDRQGAANAAAGVTERPGIVLGVNGLETEFRSRGGIVRAVRDVSLELERTQKVGIVGESGSGKSAFALSVLGLLEPPGYVVGGEVMLNGRDISGLDDRAMQSVRGREISIVFQDPMSALNPVKSIGQQIVETIRMHQPNIGKKGARAAAIELLRDVEVPGAARRIDDYPHQYSGGMRQRVMIAIALANGPDVLIADEPTTALDVTTQAQVLRLLDRLVTERGTAVILITHNLGIVAQFCDFVYVMYAGRVVERASTAELFARPIHPYTEALLGAVPRPDQLERGPLASIPGIPPDLAALGPGCAFEPRCPLGRGREVCAEQAPVPTQVSGFGGQGSVAECHFADERASDATSKHGSET